MSLHISSKLGFILIIFLVSTSLAQLLEGISNGKIRPGIQNAGKIRPGIVPDEPSGPLDEVKENSKIEIEPIKGKSL